jgi:hypothetical protein
MRQRLLIVSVFLMLIAMAGCGGGGGSTPTPTPTPTQPTTAKLVLSTSGTLPSGVLIGGIDIIVKLPAGVSVKTDSASTAVSSSVMAASGQAASGSLVVGNYATASNTVHIVLVNAAGFGVGEYITLTCDIAAGTTPTAASFSLSNFSSVGTNTQSITTLTPTFTADIK